MRSKSRRSFPSHRNSWTLERRSVSSTSTKPETRRSEHPARRRADVGLGLRLSVVRPLFTPHNTLSRVCSRSFTHTIVLSQPFPRHVRTWLPQTHQRIPLRHMAFFPFSKSANSSPHPSQVAEISKLEAAADSDPNNVDTQVQLFRSLLGTGMKTGYNVIMSRWERMCEFVRP